MAQIRPPHPHPPLLGENRTNKFEHGRPSLPFFSGNAKVFFQGSSFLPNMSWKDEGLGKLSLAVLHCLLVISQLLCNFFSVTRMDWGHGSDRLRAKGMKGEVQMHIIWEKGKITNMLRECGERLWCCIWFNSHLWIVNFWLLKFIEACEIELVVAW